jgi:cellulose synthase/poly-beta-1,6-N-acetylglucosamine synthase-like glycosyltransferase
MQNPALILFALSIFTIAYVYALYPLLLALLAPLARRRTPPVPADGELPSVHVCIPAFNEEKIIARKIESVLNADYPSAKLTITVVSDCSTDSTDAIIEQYRGRGIEFIRNEKQKGKIASLSSIGMRTRADIFLITDANAIFEPDALKKLMARFSDPRVGIANGNKVLSRTPTMVGHGEGIYWIYETFIKNAESRLFSNAFITGAMTAIRRELFIEVPAYLEFDHVLPLHAVNSGYRVVFEPAARFSEETAPSSRAEWRVRVRNAVRGFTMVVLMNRYIDLLRHPWFTLHVYSRKILRWLIGIPAIGLLVTNLFLLDLAPFRVLLAGQAAFYAMACIGFLLDRLGIKQMFLALPYYFCLVNCASLIGMIRALQGRRMAVWSTGR